jgi:hypothetical protein
MSNCNQFQFITGVITFPAAYNSSTGKYNENATYYAAMDLVTRYSFTELQVHYHQAANALLLDVADEDTSSNASRTANFSFCGNSCAMIAIRSEDYNSDFSITSNYYQLVNGSCRNIFPVENW